MPARSRSRVDSTASTAPTFSSRSSARAWPSSTAVTAPLHGFRDAIDYWTRSSCKQYLGGIAIPTLVLNARNDPFLPPAALARPAEVSASVVLDYPVLVVARSLLGLWLLIYMRGCS